MKTLLALTISLMVLTQAAAAQSLADLARKERERKAKEQKSSVQVTTDEVKAGKLDLSPPLDPARKGDLEYLLQQLSHPRASNELLAAFVPLKDRAIPKLVPLLSTPEPLKRVAPATVLTVLGNSEGIAAMAHMLGDAIAAASAGAEGGSAAADESFRQRMEATREADYALGTTKFGVWRMTEGSTMTPDQVVTRLQKGPPIEIVGGVDNGQKIFSRALHDKDPNLRLAAVALIRVATGGKDFGYQAEQPPEQNEAAIQQINTFLATERVKVVAELGTKKK